MQIANFLQICMQIFNAAKHMQIFWSYAYLRAHDLRTEWKIFKDFPAQQGILLLLLHLTKLANAKSDKEERLQILPQANSAKILKGQCDENIV